MAHRPLSRTSLAAGLAATLLITPAAGPALALGGGDVTDETSAPSDPTGDTGDATGSDPAGSVEETVDGAVDAATDSEAAAAVSEPAAPVDDPVEAATDAAGQASDGVREVVEKAASGDPGGAVDSAAGTVHDTTDTVSGVVEGVVDGGVETGGDDPDEVSGANVSPDDESGQDGPHRTNSTPRFRPDGGFSDRSASISSGFSRNIGGGNGSPSSFEPPATSGVFDSADGSSDSAEDPDIASLSEPAEPSTAGVPNPRDIPMSLVLTATALLALVGAGHVLHAVRRSGLQFG